MGSEEFVVLMFAVPHPPQRLRVVQNEVWREGLPVARPLAKGRVLWAVVSGSPSLMVPSSTLASGTFPSVWPRKAGGSGSLAVGSGSTRR